MDVYFCGDREEPNLNLCFVRSLEAGRWSLRLVAGDAYQVFLDGVLIHAGPARAAHGYSRADEFIISSVRNAVLVIAVCSYHCNSLSHANQPAFFGCEVSQEGKIIYTALDFSAYRNPARIQRAPRMNIQRCFAEAYRMDMASANWRKGEFLGEPMKLEATACPKILERGVPLPRFIEVYGRKKSCGKARLDKTRPRWDISEWVDRRPELGGYRRAELEDSLTDDLSALVTESGEAEHENFYRIYDFRGVRSGFLRMRVRADGPVRMLVSPDETLTEERVNPQRYKACLSSGWTILESGEYDCLTFEPYTARYVQIAVFGCAEILGVSMIAFESPAAERLAACTEDRSALAVIEAARHTYEQNAVDIYTDCPGRERAGWLCDSYFTARAERLFCGDSRTETCFLENFLLAPPLKDIPAGMLPMCYPADHIDGVYIPNWAMWAVIELDEYKNLRDGKTSLVSAFREKTEALVQFFAGYENEWGLLEGLDGWVFLEWSPSNDFVRDVNFPTNMLYAMFLDSAGRLYHRQDYTEKANRIRERIRREAFDGEFFADNALRGEDGVLRRTRNRTETCQYYALFTRTAEGEEYRKLFSRMERYFGMCRNSRRYPDMPPSNAFIGNYLRLYLLLREGRCQKLYAECLKNFAPMARKTDTLWEMSDQRASCDHGFASCAAELLVCAVTGYRGFSAERKEVYWSRNRAVEDGTFRIPAGEDEIIATVRRGETEYKIPENYRLVERTEEIWTD